MCDNKITISKGNNKLGVIPSVSLPAWVTCRKDAPCYKSCYARRLAARREGVRHSYEKNLEVLENNPATYWAQVRGAVAFSRYFRFHVSGDIPNREYFAEMVKTAEDFPFCNMLVFTKQFEIVNEWLSEGRKIPDNLKVIFSNWERWKCHNPHNLPVCEVIKTEEDALESWKICGGNCSECACRGIGCWELKKGETIAIYKH